MTQSKAAIRREQKQVRRTLSSDARNRATSAILRQLRNLREYGSARRVAVYFPVGGEIDTSAICVDLWHRKKTCYLPVLIEKPTINLGFAKFTADSVMSKSSFGIPEPDVPSRDLLPAPHLDLVLLPMVAFDRTGNRLGMGGGYYDTALAFRKNYGHQHRPRLYGLAYAHQEITAVPTEPWDIRLDGVVTENEIIFASTS